MYRPDKADPHQTSAIAQLFRMAAILAGIFPRFAKSTEAVYRESGQLALP